MFIRRRIIDDEAIDTKALDRNSNLTLQSKKVKMFVFFPL